MKNVLNNKVAIITGSTQGLGLEIAKHFLLAGSHVILNGRDKNRSESAREQLVNITKKGKSIEIFNGDISIPGIAEQIIDFTLRKFNAVDVLVNNAGVYGPMGALEESDWDHWIKAFNINFFGSVLLIKAVLPIFKEKRKGKIIQVSGGGATKPLPFISSYAASKASIVRFCETIASEVKDFNIDINSIAPGALNTQMLDELLAINPESVGKDFYNQNLKVKESGGTPLEVGAELAVFLASNDSDGITGKLISAVWDNWQSWPEHKEVINNSDMYTLRRISGRDRDFEEGDQ